MRPNEGIPRRLRHRERRKGSPTVRAWLISNCVFVMLMGVFVMGVGVFVYLSLVE